MSTPRFGTAITCVDGRIQLPVIKWIMDKHGVDYVDLVTEPGADSVLANYQITQMIGIKERARVSVERHRSRLVAVVGHYDCTAAPGTEKEHHKQILRAVKLVRTWGLRADVIGLWVNEKWKVEEVAETW